MNRVIQQDNLGNNQFEDNKTEKKLNEKIQRGFNSELSWIPEESKKEEIFLSHNPQEKNTSDFILNFDTSLNNNKENEEEESKIQNLDVNNPRKDTSINLLGLNDLKEPIEKNLISKESINESSSIFSQSIMISERLEGKEGWLLKRSFKSPSVIGWQRRYWVIKNQKFMYYKSENKKKLDGVIDFNLLTCLITIPKGFKGEDIIVGKYISLRLLYNDLADEIL